MRVILAHDSGRWWFHTFKLVAYSTAGGPWNQSEHDSKDETSSNISQVKFCVHFSHLGYLTYITSLIQQKHATKYNEAE
jgi:hypothetical protein